MTVRLPDIQKAQYGHPCNGCGLCCLESVCDIGQFVFLRKQGPCPALEVADDRYQCGLVANPARYASQTALAESGAERLANDARLLTATGAGCDYNLGGSEPKPPKAYRRAKKQASKPKTRRRALAAFNRWLPPLRGVFEQLMR